MEYLSVGQVGCWQIKPAAWRGSNNDYAHSNLYIRTHHVPKSLPDVHFSSGVTWSITIFDGSAYVPMPCATLAIHKDTANPDTGAAKSGKSGQGGKGDAKAAVAADAAQKSDKSAKGGKSGKDDAEEVKKEKKKKDKTK